MTRRRPRKKGPPGSRWVVRAQTRGGRGTFETGNVGIFDELVVDDWFHVEQTDTRVWWMRVGDLDVWVRLPRDGKPKVRWVGWT